MTTEDVSEVITGDNADSSPKRKPKRARKSPTLTGDRKVAIMEFITGHMVSLLGPEGVRRKTMDKWSALSDQQYRSLVTAIHDEWGIEAQKSEDNVKFKRAQIRRLLRMCEQAMRKGRLGDYVRIETLMAKMMGTLAPIKLETDKLENVVPFPDKKRWEILAYAETGYWPTLAEVAAKGNGSEQVH